MAQTPFKARLGLETPTGQDVNSGGDFKINGVSINTGGTLDNVFYLDTNDMDDVADGATYVKTENNLTDSLKTNYDSAYTHSTTTTGNPHSVTKSDVGLSDVVNADTTTTANITDSVDKRFVTDAEKTVIGDTSGTNSGDQTASDFDIKDLTDSTNLRTTWSGKQDALTFGIADTNSVIINDTDAVATDYVRFTATGVEGRDATEVKTDLGLENVVNADTTNADNISDGATNAIITLTQETNFETAYSKSHDQNTDTGTSSDDFSIGDGTDTDKTISIDNGDANSPQLKYNASTNTWQYSNDGTTFNDIGTLPSNLVYTDQENIFTETQIIPAIKPSVDSTTAFQITKADGTTTVLNIDTSTGRVGIGTSEPGHPLEVYSASGKPKLGITSTGEAQAGIIRTKRLNGTSASPTEVLSGEFIGRYLFLGQNNDGNCTVCAEMRAVAEANFGAVTNGPAALAFLTSDTTTLAERMRISSAGKVTIGATYTAPTLDNEVATKKYVDDNSGGGSTLAKLQQIYGLLANQNGVNYTGTLNNNTITVHTTAASSKSFFNFSFTNTTNTAQTISLLVDDIVVYKEELNPYENRNLADVLHQPYFVANTHIKVQSASTVIVYNINVIDVLDSELTGFFMLVGNTTADVFQTLKTAGASTKIKLLGEVFSNTDTVNRTITTKINDRHLLQAQTIGVNQGCLAMLNQGKTINSSQTYKIISNSSNVNYLVFGYEG